MAWVRLHDGAMTHPKVVGMFDWRDPFHVWIWGMSYCQTHLTDGFITAVAVPRTGLKSAGALIVRGLWEGVDGGWQVHDYLDWNDSRELVTRKRTEAKERMSSARRSSFVPPAVRVNSVENFAGCSREVLRGLVKSSSSEGESEGKLVTATDPFTDSSVTERAGRFLERYPDLYAKHRKGARYAVRPVRDYAAAVTLCQTWPDDRLDKLAVIFLTTDHEFAESGSRTVPQFLGLASWCDGKLAEHEAEQRSATA